MKAAPLLICVLVLGSSKDRSFFVTSAPTQTPTTNGNLEIVPDNKDPDVSQLESLKLPSDKSVSVSKSQSATYSDVNGHKQAFVSQQTDVDVDGKLVGRLKQSSNNGGRIRTSLELPQHERTPEQLAAQNSIDKVLYTNGVQYSPLDMAEYVFWTGDEKGVTLAIEDFLEDGMMTQDEALTFLQEIKLNLDYLQEHYSQQGFRSNDLQKEDLGSKLKLNVHQNDPVESFRNIIDEFNQDNQYDTMNILKNDINKKDSINRPSIGQTPQRGPKQPEHVINDEEYETLLERLRVADFLYTQYSLEEVIYQLAKVMFSQSLTRGSTEAQEALQKFTTFLESETEQGHISRSLEKKVLDVLIAALTDVLTEHPELVSAARKGLGGDGALQLPPDNNILQHILEYTPNEKQDTVKPSYSLFKNQGHQNNFYQQNKEILERIKSKQMENREFKH